MKLRKNDTVKITQGKDKGRTGKIEKVLVKKGTLVIAGINIYKKHVKPQGEGKPGGIMEVNRPLNVAKVSLICPKCNKATRVNYQFDKSHKKERICQKCKAII